MEMKHEAVDDVSDSTLFFFVCIYVYRYKKINIYIKRTEGEINKQIKIKIKM